MIYMDNSATTRCFDEVAQLMADIMCNDYGNPSSAHHLGVTAEAHIKKAKDIFAQILRCKADELIFTSGGTESDNLAILGAARANKRSGNHIVTTVVEHPAVLRTMEQLQEEGFDITYLPVDKDGCVSIDSVEKAVSADTILVSVMHTNNEVGALQGVREIGELLKRRYPGVIFHVDAVQGFGKARIYPKESGIDMLSVSAHKIHGPKGVGLLYIADKTKVEPIIYGGGQQKGLRSGTENVAGIAGFAMAAKMLYDELEAERERLYNIKTELVRGLSSLEGVQINGIPGCDLTAGIPAACLNADLLSAAIRNSAPHIVSASFAGVRAEVLLHALEEKDIYVSAGSACATHKPEPSRTLQAMGLKKEMLEGTLRFSLSKFNDEKEPQEVVRVLNELLGELRKFTRR